MAARLLMSILGLQRAPLGAAGASRRSCRVEPTTMPPPADTAPVAATEPPAPALRAEGLNAWYGAHQAIATST